MRDAVCHISVPDTGFCTVHMNCEQTAIKLLHLINYRSLRLFGDTTDGVLRAQRMESDHEKVARALIVILERHMNMDAHDLTTKRHLAEIHVQGSHAVVAKSVWKEGLRAVFVLKSLWPEKLTLDILRSEALASMQECLTLATNFEETAKSELKIQLCNEAELTQLVASLRTVCGKQQLVHRPRTERLVQALQEQQDQQQQQQQLQLQGHHGQSQKLAVNRMSF